MKNFAIVFFTMFLSMFVFGQNQSTHLMEVEVIPPRFTGVDNVMMPYSKTTTISNYLAARFEYPVKNRLLFEGIEVIHFIVNADGLLTDFVVVNSVSPQIDEEVVEILKSSNGMWKPGYNNGEAIAMEKEVTLEIRVGETKKVALKHDFEQKAQYSFSKGTNLFFIKGKPARAMKFLDAAVRYQPYDKSAYFARGLCRYEMGYTEGARQDWMRLKEIGGFDMVSIMNEYKLTSLKGYEEFVTMFSE